MALRPAGSDTRPLPSATDAVVPEPENVHAPPTSALPTIGDPVIIDGYSQPGARANTLATGSDASLLIEIDGTTVRNDGFTLGGGGSTLRGLVINRFDTGIRVISDNNVIAGDFGETVVIDWGLARRMGPRGAAASAGAREPSGRSSRARRR